MVAQHGFNVLLWVKSFCFQISNIIIMKLLRCDWNDCYMTDPFYLKTDKDSDYLGLQQAR